MFPRRKIIGAIASFTLAGVALAEDAAPPAPTTQRLAAVPTVEVVGTGQSSIPADYFTFEIYVHSSTTRPADSAAEFERLRACVREIVARVDPRAPPVAERNGPTTRPRFGGDVAIEQTLRVEPTSLAAAKSLDAALNAITGGRDEGQRATVRAAGLDTGNRQFMADENFLVDPAKRAAIANAREAARRTAADADMKLGRLLSIGRFTITPGWIEEHTKVAVDASAIFVFEMTE